MRELHRLLIVPLVGLCLAGPAASQQQGSRQTPPPPLQTDAAPDSVPQMPPALNAPPETTDEPAVPPASAPGPQAPAAPAPAADEIEFQLRFPESEGGGSASGSAGSLDYKRDDYAVLTGNVKIRYQDIDLKADRAEIDLSTKIVTAEGNVIVDQGPRRMAGDTLEFDLDTKTGTLQNATAQVSPDYYFSGKEVAKVGDDVYTVKDGVFTSCSQEVPDWSFRLSEATVEVEGYARIHDASMRAKKLPVFYTPYILWPVRTERSPGFLIPNVGYSDRRGASLGLAYYQTLGRSYDTTFHLDLFSKQYLGLGNELRYHPTEGTRGNFIGYAVRDPESEEEFRWKLEWSHETTDLPRGMRGVVQFQDFSDFNFFREFERDFDRNTLRFLDSRAFVAGNWGPHLLNLMINERETFVGEDSTVEQRKLPELEYRLRSTRLGRVPLYAEFEGSVSYLDLVRPDSYSGRYGRIDAFPQLTLPIRTFPWLSLSVTAGERFTWYETSVVDPDGQGPLAERLEGEALTRAVPFGSAEIVGPSFSRLFDRGFAGYGRFKHVIEPRWRLTYLGEVEEQDEVPLFDEVDRLFSTRLGRASLVNRILAKPQTKAGKEGSAREIFLFELARRYSLDADEPLQRSQLDRSVNTTQGPLEAIVRFNPTERTSVKFEADYSTLFSGLQSTQLSADLGIGRGNFLNLTWFTRFQPEVDETVENQVRFGGSIALFPQIRLQGQINYSIEQQLLQEQRYVLDFAQQCYGLRVEMRDFRAERGSRLRDKDVRFSLTLKNVGTFLDLTSRTSGNEP